MGKKVSDCVRCDAPVFIEGKSVCGSCHKELSEMHEKAEALYAKEYEQEIGAERAAKAAREVADYLS